MQAHLIRAAEVGPARIAQWQALAARALEPNPWFEPAVVLALDEVRRDVVLLIAEDTNRMLACLPLIPVRRSRFDMRVPQWITPHPMGVPLVDPDAAEASLGTMFRFAAGSRETRSLLLQELHAEGPATAAAARAFGEGWRSRLSPAVLEWPALRRRSQPTYVRDALGPKQHHNVQRLRRRLEEHVGAALRLVDQGSDLAMVEQYLALERSGWKGRRGTALACDPPMARYFRRACALFAAEGRLHTYVLEAGDVPLAMKIMVTAGAGLFELRVAYDEDFARYSPGVLLEVEAVDAFHAGEWSWAVSNTQHPSSPLFRVWPDRMKTADIQADACGAVRRFLKAIAPA